MPTWLHFPSIFPPVSYPWGLLGVSGGVLEVSSFLATAFDKLSVRVRWILRTTTKQKKNQKANGYVQKANEQMNNNIKSINGIWAHKTRYRAINGKGRPLRHRLQGRRKLRRSAAREVALSYRRGHANLSLSFQVLRIAGAAKRRPQRAVPP